MQGAVGAEAPGVLLQRSLFASTCSTPVAKRELAVGRRTQRGECVAMVIRHARRGWGAAARGRAQRRTVHADGGRAKVVVDQEGVRLDVRREIRGLAHRAEQLAALRLGGAAYPHLDGGERGGHNGHRALRLRAGPPPDLGAFRHTRCREGRHLLDDKDVLCVLELARAPELDRGRPLVLRAVRQLRERTAPPTQVSSGMAVRGKGRARTSVIAV